ncbi:MAG: signal peptidase II [Alphaproteobacteria bacterium]|nr:signal peptidase II [Alphaproteobacteria bacterium]
MSENTKENQQLALWKKRTIWLLIILFILITDQISKWMIMEQVMRPLIYSVEGHNLFEWYGMARERLPFQSIEVTSFFNLVMAWNTGVSFSILSGQGDYMPWVLIGVALLITAIFVFWLYRANNILYGVSYALVIGGAMGNVIDRARFGAVIDFLDFHAMGYHWPAFNVADMAVVSGVALLIVLSLLFDIDPKEGYRKDQTLNTANEAPK